MVEYSLTLTRCAVQRPKVHCLVQYIYFVHLEIHFSVTNHSIHLNLLSLRLFVCEVVAIIVVALSFISITIESICPVLAVLLVVDDDNCQKKGFSNIGVDLGLGLGLGIGPVPFPGFLYFL